MIHFHKPKDDGLAGEYRNKGNQMFMISKFFEALQFYNKSLCLAKIGSKNIALAFGNRSAAYLEVKEFGKCLENIKLARDAGYPEEKLDRLNEREQRCVKQMNQQTPSDDEDPWTFFKLSYPPNKNYPAMADCLELRSNEKYGRHIVTNRDLKPGDIIAIEEALFKGLSPGTSYIRCAKCFKSNKMSLIPSRIWGDAMFCSQECLDYGKGKYMCALAGENCFCMENRILFEALDMVDGDLNKLNLLTDPELRNKTVFDLDLSNPADSNYKYNQLLVFNSLAEYPIPTECEKTFKIHPIPDLWSTKREIDIVENFMRHIYHRSENGITLAGRVEYGFFIFSLSSLFSHSCCQNTLSQTVDDKFVVSVAYPIKKGEQIFWNYGPIFSKNDLKERRKWCLEKFNFICSCAACENDWTLENLPRRVDRSFQFSDPIISSIKDAKTVYESNITYIQKKFKNYPCFEIWHLQAINAILINIIAERFLFKNFYR